MDKFDLSFGSLYHMGFRNTPFDEIRNENKANISLLSLKFPVQDILVGAIVHKYSILPCLRKEENERH